MYRSCIQPASIQIVRDAHYILNGVGHCRVSCPTKYQQVLVEMLNFLLFMKTSLLIEIYAADLERWFGILHVCRKKGYSLHTVEQVYHKFVFV